MGYPSCPGGLDWAGLSSTLSRVHRNMDRIFPQTTTMAHWVNVNPTDEELDEDPGAYIIKFGKHVGERLDSIPTGYRLWATGAECQRFHWVRTQSSKYDCH
jgi:hypothetical protein